MNIFDELYSFIYCALKIGTNQENILQDETRLDKMDISVKACLCISLFTWNMDIARYSNIIFDSNDKFRFDAAIFVSVVLMIIINIRHRRNAVINMIKDIEQRGEKNINTYRIYGYVFMILPYILLLFHHPFILAIT